MPATSGSSVLTAAMIRARSAAGSPASTLRVYEPTGTDAAPIASFNPGRVSSASERTFVLFAGTASTRRFAANTTGRSTRRSACSWSGLDLHQRHHPVDLDGPHDAGEAVAGRQGRLGAVSPRSA